VFDTVKTVRLDWAGRHLEEVHRDARLDDVVQQIITEYPASLISAEYIR